MKINSYRPSISSYIFPIYNYVIILSSKALRTLTFVTKYRSLIAEINFTSNISIPMDHNLFAAFLVCLKQVSNELRAESLTTSNISLTEGVYKYSYDNSRYIISDISFKVDGTVFD